MRRLMGPVVGVTFAALAASCLVAGGSAGTVTRQNAVLSGSITVSAASSLTAAFGQIAVEFHREYKHATVTLNFGASPTLADQILSGAPSDVFASADSSEMTTLVKAHAVRETPRIFTRDTLEIAVRPGNPRHVTGLSSLARDGVIALCASGVPCGDYAQYVLRRAGVRIPSSNITREPNASSTVEQVSYGDATAAIVYVTDVHAQARLVSAVKIPARQNTIASYPIARLASSRNPRLAQAFVNFVEGRTGQRALRSQGFLAP